MPEPAVQFEGLQAIVETTAIADRRLACEILGGTLRLTLEALNSLLEPASPMRVVRILPGRICLTGTFKGMDVAAEVRPAATAEGRALIEVVSARIGFLPLPVSLLGLFGSAIQDRPGIRLTGGNDVEVDLAHLARPLGIQLPPLQSARTDDGVLELRF